MHPSQKDIILQLQKEILPLQGFRPQAGGRATAVDLGPLNHAFPNACLPAGAVHEFISNNQEATAASCGFIGGVLSALMQGGRACIWIGTRRTLFPPALKAYGIEPHHLIFIDVPNQKELPWMMEEALKCEGLAAVVGELTDLNFTASRRLQLAVEKSRVTGFLLRQQPKTLNTVACVARWQITPLHSVLEAGMPGLGFPRWQVELLKVRNGRPGCWQLAWKQGAFHAIEKAMPVLRHVERRKTG